MRRGQRKNRAGSLASKAASSRPLPRHPKLVNLALLVAFVAMVGTVVVISSTPDSPTIPTRTGFNQHIPQPSQPTITPADYAHIQLENDFAIEPESLDELLVLEPDELAEVDIARMNLLVAEGLPGAEELGEQAIERYLTQIDRWAQRVKHETERHLYRLTDPRYRDHAEHFEHSEARFRAAWLVDVLQQDIGVHYHAGFVPADEKVPPFETSKETFIHGVLSHEDASQNAASIYMELSVSNSARVLVALVLPLVTLQPPATGLWVLGGVWHKM